MAVSGVILAGFVLAHLIGNLQIFLGPDQFNGYRARCAICGTSVAHTRGVLLIMVMLPSGAR